MNEIKYYKDKTSDCQSFKIENPCRNNNNNLIKNAGNDSNFYVIIFQVSFIELFFYYYLKRWNAENVKKSKDYFYVVNII